MSIPVPDETIQDRRGSSEPAPLLRLPHLFLALECGRPFAGGARYALSQIDEVVIARGATRRAERLAEHGVRRLLLQIPDGHISGRHACLRRRGDAWEFEDLGSRNGSCIDGRPVSGRTDLSDRSVLEVGHTFLMFRSGLPTPVETLGDQDSSTLTQTSAGLRTLLPDLSAGLGTLVRIARSAVPVLLLGETGSGKELLARAVHAQSTRSGAFVAVNCGAIPDSLIESHFFGHVRGAFSGASRDEPGLVRAAHRGSLFLDEIAELPQVSQSALLRVLQEQEVVPVGSTQPVAVDVRIVAATHAPIEELVNSGRFRNDLFARIAGFRFVIPPLRERLEDFGIFVAHLLQELVPDQSAPWCFEPDAARVLLSHDWPRNLRELQQCLASATALANGHLIQRAHLALRSESPPPSRVQPPPSASARPNAPLRDELLAHFKECDGNVSEVARRMGKARVQIQRWMARFGIDPAQFKPPP